MSTRNLIARNLSEAGAFRPCTLTIGNFDGVHLAHRRLLQTTVEAARSAGARPAVLMFDPHPGVVFGAPRKVLDPEFDRPLIGMKLLANSGLNSTVMFSWS